MLPIDRVIAFKAPAEPRREQDFAGQTSIAVFANLRRLHRPASTPC